MSKLSKAQKRVLRKMKRGYYSAKYLQESTLTLNNLVKKELLIKETWDKLYPLKPEIMYKKIKEAPNVKIE